MNGESSKKGSKLKNENLKGLAKEEIKYKVKSLQHGGLDNKLRKPPMQDQRGNIKVIP